MGPRVHWQRWCGGIRGPLCPAGRSLCQEGAKACTSIGLSAPTVKAPRVGCLRALRLGPRKQGLAALRQEANTTGAMAAAAAAFKKPTRMQPIVHAPPIALLGSTPLPRAAVVVTAVSKAALPSAWVPRIR